MKGRQVSNEEVRVDVESFARELELDIVSKGRGEIVLSSISVSRPGLQLSGYFVHFDRARVQVIGNAENEYLNGMTPEKRYKALENLIKREIPCLIIARNMEVMPEVRQLCEKYDCPLLHSKKITTVLINDITAYKSEVLAPTHVSHGVLVDVFGIGIMIVGKSGVGKSEIALDLVNRGHRLVADDSIIIKNINDQLIGKSPKNIRYFMEIRGIGIINVKSMFGSGAVLPEKSVELIAELVPWDQMRDYDRLGDEKTCIDILGVQTQKLLIPVSPGRNIPIIIETAARKFRLEQLGYSAVDELVNSTFKK